MIQFLLLLVGTARPLPGMDEPIIHCPPRLQMAFNVIQNVQQEIPVLISRLQAGESVRFRILADCNQDGKPDRQPVGDCACPIYRSNLIPSDEYGYLRHDLNIAALEKAQEKRFPQEQTLWFDVVRPEDRPGSAVRFGIVSNPCTLWKTIAALFFDGECSPGLMQALDPHRGLPDLLDIRFEVRTLDAGKGILRPKTVPGTYGANGIAWYDKKCLLVTIGQSGQQASASEPSRPGAGLYLVKPNKDRPKCLWQAPPGWEPSAPFRMNDGKVLFVREQIGMSKKKHAPVAWLSRLARGRIDQEVPLYDTVHQVIAADVATQKVLGLTFGNSKRPPTFVQIDLVTHEVVNLGYHGALYAAATREPGTGNSAVALEMNGGNYGWDLVMIDAKGHYQRDLVVRRGRHDLMPVWRPGGEVFAYLAEVNRIE